ncbi:MAG: endonuclease domain-containing protein [Anaerolineae bacterium]|nr:endonuclease domain-containing protein [Anaerolineae bacterium]
MDDPTLTPFDTSPELWEELKPLARQMRHEPTLAESKLWQELRNRRCCNAKFRRQHAIERFIVDFCCLEAMVIIEVDGPIHEYTPEQDATRQAYLEALGFVVLRFMNDEVLSEMRGVLERIAEMVLPRM